MELLPQHREAARDPNEIIPEFFPKKYKSLKKKIQKKFQQNNHLFSSHSHRLSQAHSRLEFSSHVTEQLITIDTPLHIIISLIMHLT